MPYGIFYAQYEITKHNGRLCSAEEAMQLSESKFLSQLGVTLVRGSLTQEQALEDLKSRKCELNRAQFWAIGSGYCAYMYAAVEYDERDGEFMPYDGEFAEWQYPQDDEEG